MQYQVLSEEETGRTPALSIASPWERFGAYLVDGFLATVVCITGFLLGFVVGDASNFFIIGLAISGLYAVFVLMMVAIRGQPPGKLVIGIKIVKVDGRSPGFGGMLLREIIGKFASSVVFYLGFIWILVDHKHQGWHDKIAETYVVRV
jgi:uncharacterized RDD family membrane protein YckC